MNTAILSQLYVHQSEVKSAMAAKRALLAAETMDTMATANARWRLTRMLTGYQVFKHQRIFDPLSRHGTPRDSDAAKQMKIGCVAMNQTFRTYLARWTASGIEGHEAEYRRDARAILAMIDRHILSERRTIEMLLTSDRQAA
ncbi:MAG: hypothetical protein EOP62_03425 [Sphingomonadales bacterium]|nr:MAG: hypothetical protein EOP62_03425 [Sphingomonadales bacterium]